MRTRHEHPRVFDTVRWTGADRSRGVRSVPEGESQRSLIHLDEAWRLPKRLYVAARTDRASGGPVLESRAVGEGNRPAVLAYSSLDAFVAGCGADQPWMLLAQEHLEKLAQDRGLGFSVLLDVPLPTELRGTAGGMAGEESRWDRSDSPDWDTIHIPSRRFRPGQERAELELQPMPGERLAIMAYSSQASLEHGCGPQQPWVSIPAGLMPEARRQSGAHTICLDTPLPEHLRHGQENDP